MLYDMLYTYFSIVMIYIAGLKYSQFSYNVVIVIHGVSKVFWFVLYIHKMHKYKLKLNKHFLLLLNYVCSLLVVVESIHLFCDEYSVCKVT